MKTARQLRAARGSRKTRKQDRKAARFNAHLAPRPRAPKVAL